MLSTPMPKLILQMSIPTMITQLISITYNTADTYFVSQIDTSAAAAVGVVFSLMSIIHAFGASVGVGANSLISRLLGMKRDVEASRFASSALAMASVGGGLILIFGLSFLSPFMRLLGSTETILPYACDYSRYILIAAPIMCGSFVLNNILRAEGEALLAMFGIGVGGILNIFLDPLFIFTFGMGISGAALATVISQTISFGILLSIFIRGKGIVRLGIRRISMSFSDYAKIFRVGLPTVFRQGLASIASAQLNIMASPFGDAAIAAITIAYKVYMLVRHLVMGIGQGFQPVAGYNFGAGNLARVKKAFGFTVFSGTIVCVLGALLSSVFAETIMRCFRNDLEVIFIGERALLFASAIMPFMAYSTYVNQLYQCLGFSVGATFLASCRQGICFIPLLFILRSLWGLTGLEAAQAAADMATFIISIPFHIRFFKKTLSEKAPPESVAQRLKARLSEAET